MHNMLLPNKSPAVDLFGNSIQGLWRSVW